MAFNEVFKALSDKTRRRILELLKEEDKTAGEIADYFNITKASISHHLSILKQANLVTDERQGQFIYYSLNTSVFEDIAGWIMELSDKNKNEGEEDEKEK